MYTIALITALFGATAFANGMMSESGHKMMTESNNNMMYGGGTTMMGDSSMISSTTTTMMGANSNQKDGGGSMNTMVTTTSGMYGGYGLMSSTMSMPTSTTSAMGAASTQQNNAASCANQANSMTTGMGDQIVTIVQVSDLNGTTLRYSPENIVAPVGSIVQFQFHPKNHTITESSFADPCKPLAKNLTSAQRPGQRSGFVPVSAMDTDMKVYNMLVNDTKPIWIFCGQVGHCQKGMVMVVNQNPTDSQKTLENYRAAAMALPIPGASAGAPGVSSSASAAASGGSAPSSTTSAAGATSSSNANPAPAAQQASGSGNGIPAVFTGAAIPRSKPFQYAGVAGLAIAGVGALL